LASRYAAIFFSSRDGSESLFVHVVTMATMIDPNFTPQTHTLLEIRAPLQTQIMLEVALYRMW